jgi:hypothetical protein
LCQLDAYLEPFDLIYVVNGEGAVEIGAASGLGVSAARKARVDSRTTSSVHGDLLAEWLQAFELVEDALGGDPAEVGHGLTDRSESRLAECCYLNIGEAD